MDILITACGTYLVYCWYLLMFKNEIKQGVLLPSKSTGKCTDIEGYKKEMGPKLLIFAIVSLIAGIIGLISDYVMPINTYLYLAFTVVFIIVLIWFTREARKAEREYFN